MFAIGASITTAEEETTLSEKPGEDISTRYPVEEARQRAELLEQVYLATLEMLHHSYFHGDRAVVPARAMEAVFREMEQRTHSQARWISVSLKAMNIDHDPRTDFEKRSARTLRKGDAKVETIEQGFYRRAIPISLNGGCLHCHDGFGRGTSTTPKFAGLIVSVPVREGDTLPEEEAEANSSNTGVRN